MFLPALIGIPRVFLYYTFFPMWKTFFTALGAEVLVSPITTKEILDRGVRIAEDETCLPVKLAFGHAEALKSRTDFLFLPRHKSLEPGRYMCPKVIGLPDMLARNLEGLPPILSPEISVIQDPGALRKAFSSVARSLGAREPDVGKAYRLALGELDRYRRLIQEGWLPEDAGNRLLGRTSRGPSNHPLKVAVIGHSYVSCDPHISMNLLKRLEDMGATPMISDMVPPEELERHLTSLRKDLFWTFGRRLLGAGFHFAARPDCNGIILLSAFGCGSDSLIEPYVVNAARGRVPLLNLTVDEHSGEAGLVTRLEAFLDMIRRRERFESHLPAHG